MADLEKDTTAAGSEEVPSAASQLFDLRIVIALLFGIYGVILTIMGIIGDTQAELDKAGGLHINLWTGIGMLVVAAAFVLWQRLRPMLSGTPSDDTPPPAGH